MRGFGWMAVILLVVIAVLGGCAALASATQIDAGTFGVVNAFGRVTGEVFGPGFHWRSPFVEHVTVLPSAIRSYETSAHPDTSQADFTDFTVDSKTSDGQVVEVSYTVIFSIQPECGPKVVQEIGDLGTVVENVVKANSRNLARLNTRNYSANDLFSGDGAQHYEAETATELRDAMATSCVSLGQFLVRDIDFDADYEQAIENQQIAEENIKTEKFNADAAEYQKQQRIRQAEADKQAKILDAEAQAQARILEAQAEAQAIEAQGNSQEDRPFSPRRG